jgi:RNA polymerase subunit RPABC4/transcription elongation factor Spt4
MDETQMNPRRLDGGSQELASLILHSLQGAFPGVEFSLEPLDQTEFGVYWRYKAPGAPSEKDVRVYMALHWPSIDAKLRDSDGPTPVGRRGGMTAIESPLQTLRPKKKSVKVCRHCHAENRRSAKVCNNCGYCFPWCVMCNRTLQEEDKFCPGCGITRCTYVD